MTDAEVDKIMNEWANSVDNEAAPLKEKGQGDGLHNIANQNKYLAKISVQLSSDIRTLKSTIIELDRGNGKLSCVMLWLTVAGFILAIIQAVAAIPVICSLFNFYWIICPST